MQVKLIRGGNLLLMQPWVPQLTKVLSYKVQERSVGTWPVRYEFTTKYLYVPEGKDAVIFGGMFITIINELKRLGIEYIVEDSRNPLPEPSYEQINCNFREHQAEIIAAICTSHSGIIAAATGFGKTHLIVQLTRIYPNEKILVTTPRKNVVADIYSRIVADNSGRVSMCDGSHKFIPESQVIVCTTKSLKKIDPEWPTKVLFDECHGAAAEGIKECLIGFDGPTMHGFSASHEGRRNGTDILTKALFGEVIYTVDYKEAEKNGSVAPIEVRMVKASGDEVVASTDITKQRRGYWRNDVRNKLIQAACKTFKDEQQVLVIVKTSEHALVLRKLLPDFEVVHAGITKEKWAAFLSQGLVTEEDEDRLKSPDTIAMKEQFRDGKLLKVIATGTWREGVDFPLLYGLVRADGDPGNIPTTQIGGRLSRGSILKTLIDFTDDFGSWLRRRAQERVRGYKKKGWRIVDDWDPTA